MSDAPTIRIKVQIYCGEEIAMGPGKADLLDAIRGHGSISAAARALGMSYRRAWLLVDAMNRCWIEPLVLTMPGRTRAHSACLTALGDEILATYRRMQASLNGAADDAAFSRLNVALLCEPRLRQPARSHASQT